MQNGWNWMECGRCFYRRDSEFDPLAPVACAVALSVNEAMFSAAGGTLEELCQSV
jgi:hypothetical protein